METNRVSPPVSGNSRNEHRTHGWSQIVGMIGVKCLPNCTFLRWQLFYFGNGLEPIHVWEKPILQKAHEQKLTCRRCVSLRRMRTHYVNMPEFLCELYVLLFRYVYSAADTMGLSKEDNAVLSVVMPHLLHFFGREVCQVETTHLHPASGLGLPHAGGASGCGGRAAGECSHSHKGTRRTLRSRHQHYIPFCVTQVQ